MSKRNNLRRYALKCKLVQMLGGKCKICGYDKCVAALDFHHRDEKTKKFEINMAVNSGYSWEDVKKEIEKCDLLCCRCHRELESSAPDIDIDDLFNEFKRKKQVNSGAPRVNLPTNKPEFRKLLKKHSINAIAKMCGCSPQTVKYWCMKYGVKPPKRANKATRIPSKKELTKLIAENSAGKVGSMFGVSDKAVKKWLDKYGLENPRNKFYRPTRINW